MRRDASYPSRESRGKAGVENPAPDAPLPHRGSDKVKDPFALGRLLIEGRFIHDDHLTEALVMQKREGSLLGECLIRIGAISRETLETVLKFQRKIRELLSKQINDKKIKIGHLLVSTGLVCEKTLERALKTQGDKKKLLGEILIEGGEISENILHLGLQTQKKILILAAASIIGISASGCATIENSRYDYLGTPVNTTPYDIRYEKIKKYLNEANNFQYKMEKDGADHWQLPYETEMLGTGDCEDKAIWLYYKFLEEGFEDVRLVVGDYIEGEESRHVWVSWHHDGRTYILDPTINDNIGEASSFPKGNYRPLYSFYRDNKWKHEM